MQKWTDFRGLRYVVLHGPKKDQLLREDADIYIINFEGLEWLLDVTKTKNAKGKTQVHVDVKRFKKFGFDVLVVDELSKLKNTQTVRFKALKRSEEHTSELQSLMRISYAILCLKKKKH